MGRWISMAMALAVLATAAIISLANNVEVPGLSPDAGTGTKCAEGNEAACKKLCTALSNVSTIKCVDHLARVFPRVHDGSKLVGDATGGGGGSDGSAPGSPTGSGSIATPPSSSTSQSPPTSSPPVNPPPTTTTTHPSSPSPPPTTTTPGPVGGVTHLVCHLNALGIKICVRV